MPVLHPYQPLLQTLVLGHLARAHPLVLNVLALVLGAEGRVVSADQAAQALGMGSRHRLARQIARAGAPPFEELAGWAQVLVWVWAWEVGQVTLARSALAVLREPSVCYRTVHRVTGGEWRIVRSRGVAWVMEELMKRLGPVAQVIPRLGTTEATGGNPEIRSSTVLAVR